MYIIKHDHLQKAKELDIIGTMFFTLRCYDISDKYFERAFIHYKFAIQYENSAEAYYRSACFFRPFTDGGLFGTTATSTKCGNIYYDTLREGLKQFPCNKILLFLKCYDDLFWGTINISETELLSLVNVNDTGDIFYYLLYLYCSTVKYRSNARCLYTRLIQELTMFNRHIVSVLDGGLDGLCKD